ncbi:MAG: GNAT family N-acetyltransferase [Eubacteriales bacterium]|nr:GNAT family N-acetyltransferase [Eubacteriales bacterium]
MSEHIMYAGAGQEAKGCPESQDCSEFQDCPKSQGCPGGRELPLGEHWRARALWENVFSEDSARFLDYYEACVADHNRIFADEVNGEIVSMLHLNPYRIWMGKEQADVSYIVAVATREEYRHQGRMGRLLRMALGECYRAKEPFAYLMPASEKIYRPFGFRTAAYQDVLTLGSVMEDKNSRLHCVRADHEQLLWISEFAEKMFSGACPVRAVRNLPYFERIWKEQEAVNGGILLFMLEDVPVGYCLTGLEDAAEVWEVAVDDSLPGVTCSGALAAVTEYFKEQLPIKVSGILPGTRMDGINSREISWRPITMVRIVCLEAFVKRLRFDRPIEALWNVKDDILPGNNGCFEVKITPEGGCARRVEKHREAVQVTVEELAEAAFGLRGLRPELGGSLRALRPLYLPELV